jgi:hypothetical protein
MSFAMWTGCATAEPEPLVEALARLPDDWPEPGETPIQPRFRPPRVVEIDEATRVATETRRPAPLDPDALGAAAQRMGAAAHPDWVVVMTRWNGGSIQGPAATIDLTRASDLEESDYESAFAGHHDGCFGIGMDGGGGIWALCPGEVRLVPMGAPDRAHRVAASFGEAVRLVLGGLDPYEAPLVDR